MYKKKKLISILFIVYLFLIQFKIFSTTKFIEIKNIDNTEMINKTKIYNGFKIKKINIINMSYFDRKKSKIQLVENIKNIADLIPKTKSKIIKSSILLKENKKYKHKDLIVSFNRIKSLNSIKKCFFDLKIINDNQIEIFIYYIDKFPLFLNPIATSFKYDNILGTNFNFYAALIPKNFFWDVYLKKIDGYLLQLNLLNICSSGVDTWFDYQDTTRLWYSNLAFDRQLNLNRSLIGRASISSDKRHILINNRNKSILNDESFKSYKISIWNGYAISLNHKKNLELSKKEYYIKLVPTLGYKYKDYFEVSKNLFNDGYTTKQNKNEFGAGIGLIRKKTINEDYVYDRNNLTKYNLGQKLYISGGYLIQSIFDQPNFRVELSNGSFFSKIGYISIDMICSYIQGGQYKDKNKLRPKTSDIDLEFKLNYISKKIGSDAWNFRQTFTIKNINKFGDNKKTKMSLNGIKYLTNYRGIRETLDQKIALTTETLFFTPLNLYIMRLDYFVFFETLHLLNYTNQKYLNHIGFGGGFLISILGLCFKVGCGYIPTMENKIGNKTLSKIIISLTANPIPHMADIDIHSPFYRSRI